MAQEDQRRHRGWLPGFTSRRWQADNQQYASLLHALTQNRLEAEGVEREMDATSRRSLVDVREAQERAEEEEFAEAESEVKDFRAALEDARSRGLAIGRKEVGYDSRDAQQDEQADMLIQYLVRPGYAQVRTEEPHPGHYVYYVDVDWARLRALAEENGHPLSF